MSFKAFRIVALMMLLASGGCAGLQRYTFVKPEMGTGFQIVMYAPNEQIAGRASAAAWARIEQLNSILSDYDSTSELSRLSQRTLSGPMSEPVHVSDDLWRVLEESKKAAELSDGAFDVTIGPMVRLWRRSRGQHELPTQQRIAEARKSVGSQYMKLDSRKHTVQLLAPRMKLDVGGIAKGYTAEEAIKTIALYGIDHALVGAAGDIAMSNPPPGKQGWHIKLEPFGDNFKEAPVYVLLKDHYGISTSGDSERFVIINGMRYSHIIDPRTGLGLTHRIGVSVIARSAFTTDWAATAVCILGPEKGIAMIEKIPHAAARITTLEDGRIKVWESSRFRQFVTQVPAQVGSDDTNTQANDSKRSGEAVR
ncbi:MAG TPA: FAD:protein FMN transferase [Tepidisphaeraceae bacterium]|nr:FAD:protein FMN transferase [Tepidisphaeraceae bacterium]